MYFTLFAISIVLWHQLRPLVDMYAEIGEPQIFHLIQRNGILSKDLKRESNIPYCIKGV